MNTLRRLIDNLTWFNLPNILKEILNLQEENQGGTDITLEEIKTGNKVLGKDVYQILLPFPDGVYNSVEDTYSYTFPHNLDLTTYISILPLKLDILNYDQENESTSEFSSLSQSLSYFVDGYTIESFITDKDSISFISFSELTSTDASNLYLKLVFTKD